MHAGHVDSRVRRLNAHIIDMDNTFVYKHHTTQVVDSKSTELICRKALDMAAHSTLYNTKVVDMRIGIQDAYIGIVHAILRVTGHQARIVEIEIVNLHIVDIETEVTLLVGILQLCNDGAYVELAILHLAEVELSILSLHIV